MQILQVHYTSCPNGISGDKRFQVRAMSAGVDSNDLCDIESHCFYKEMDYLKPEEIAARPIAYRSYRLPSGRVALTRIRYVGEDYIRPENPNSLIRQGNSFAHTLILPNQVIEQRPIDYFGWHGWKEKLEEDEINSLPPVLPSISIDELIFSTPSNFKHFLIADEQRIKRLESMIKALLMGQFDSRRLIIRGNPENNIVWITSLQYSFPVSLAKSINSSTYEQVLNTIPSLTATTENSGIVLTPTDKNYYYYVFDDYSGVDSEISTDSKWDIIAIYAKLVTHLLIKHPEQLDGFYRFIDDIGIKTLDKDTANSLGLAAGIYSLSIPELSGNSASHLSELVNYAITIPPECSAWQLIANCLDNLYHSINNELRVKLLIAESLAMPNDSYLDKAISLWRDMWLKEISENKLPSDDIKSSIINKYPEIETKLAKQLVDDSTINEAIKVLQISSTELAKYIIKEIGNALTKIGKEPVLEQVEIRKLLTALQRNSAAYDAIIPIQLSLANTAKAFEAICYGAGINDNIDQKKLPQLTELFVSELRNRSEYFSQQVRKIMPIAILIAEWTYVVEFSENPIEAYFKYLKNILSIHDDINFKYYADLTAKIINDANNVNELNTIAKLLLHFNKIQELNEYYPNQAANLLSILNNNISLLLEDEHIDDVINSRLPELAFSMNIVLKPNRVLIHRMLNNLADEKTKFPMQDLTKLHGDLLVLPDEDYLYVSEKILDFCASNKQRFISIDHLQVILNLNKPNARQFNDRNKPTEFQKRYLTWLKEVLTRCSLDEINEYTALWIRLDREIDKEGVLFSMYHEVMKVLAKTIANHFRLEQKNGFSRSKPDFWMQLKNIDGNKETIITRIAELKLLVEEAEKGVLDHVSDLSRNISKFFQNRK